MEPPDQKRQTVWPLAYLKMEQLMEFGNGEIDPVKYGVLWQKVQDMDRKMEKMERNVEELLALANKGRGGLWFGMSVVSGASALVGYMLNYFKH